MSKVKLSELPLILSYCSINFKYYGRTNPFFLIANLNDRKRETYFANTYSKKEKSVTEPLNMTVHGDLGLIQSAWAGDVTGAGFPVFSGLPQL